MTTLVVLLFLGLGTPLLAIMLQPPTRGIRKYDWDETPDSEAPPMPSRKPDPEPEETLHEAARAAKTDREKDAIKHHHEAGLRHVEVPLPDDLHQDSYQEPVEWCETHDQPLILCEEGGSGG